MKQKYFSKNLHNTEDRLWLFKSGYRFGANNLQFHRGLMLQHNRNNHLPKSKARVGTEGRNDCDPNKAEFVPTSLTSITCFSIIEIITFQNTKLGLKLRGKWLWPLWSGIRFRDNVQRIHKHDMLRHHTQKHIGKIKGGIVFLRSPFWLMIVTPKKEGTMRTGWGWIQNNLFFIKALWKSIIRIITFLEFTTKSGIIRVTGYFICQMVVDCDPPKWMS